MSEAQPVYDTPASSVSSYPIFTSPAAVGITGRYIHLNLPGFLGCPQRISTKNVIGQPMPDLPDVLSLLDRRTPILAALRTESRTKRELAEYLDVSRSTIDRAVRELESAGLVTRSGGEVSLTLPGVLALESHEQHAAELAGIDDAFDMLSSYEPDLEISPALFRDADIVAPNRHAPHRPVEALLSMLDGADEISLYATAIMPEYVQAYKESVLDGATLTCICTERVLSELLTQYENDLTTAAETGRVELHETETALPFSLILADCGNTTKACLMLYREHAVAGFIKNDAPDAVDWASHRFDDLLADAQPVSPRVEHH